MQYHSLTEADLVEIRNFRIREIEADHFRSSLLLQEAPDEAAAAVYRRDLDEMERRLALYFPVVEPAADERAESESSAKGELERAQP